MSRIKIFVLIKVMAKVISAACLVSKFSDRVAREKRQPLAGFARKNSNRSRLGYSDAGPDFAVM